MNLKCSKGHAFKISDPTEPSPFGVIVAQCSVCGVKVEAKNPAGDDGHTVAKNTFPPGERFLPAGSRISHAEAKRLGLET